MWRPLQGWDVMGEHSVIPLKPLQHLKLVGVEEERSQLLVAAGGDLVCGGSDRCGEVVLGGGRWRKKIEKKGVTFLQQ